MAPRGRWWAATVVDMQQSGQKNLRGENKRERRDEQAGSGGRSATLHSLGRGWRKEKGGGRGCGKG